MRPTFTLPIGLPENLFNFDNSPDIALHVRLTKTISPR
ncbi:MAG: DUF3187 family protein [candidate division Zixibacteria bacterium]|nr:DUF3187 family protein [candidate division Zixibacteria bacterium]